MTAYVVIVFFVGMAIWGSQRVESLHYPFSSVLVYLQRVCACGSRVVVYEVLLSLRRLVRKVQFALLSMMYAEC